MSYESFFRDLINRLYAARVCRPDQIRPCSEAEIDEIERRWGVPLPDAYRWFLRTMGRGAGQFFGGTDIFHASLGDVREQALEILREEARPIELPAEALVFAAHQGYQFWYMDLSTGGEDPPVWYFVMESEGPRRIHDQFTEFLAAEAQGMEALVKEHPNLQV